MTTAASEPVLISAVVRVVVALAAKYGIELTDGEVLAILLALEPVIATVTRRFVSPVATTQIQ